MNEGLHYYLFLLLEAVVTPGTATRLVEATTT